MLLNLYPHCRIILTRIVSKRHRNRIYKRWSQRIHIRHCLIAETIGVVCVVELNICQRNERKLALLTARKGFEGKVVAELFSLVNNKTLVESWLITSIYRDFVLGGNRDVDHLAILVADNLVDAVAICYNAIKAIADNNIRDWFASYGVCYRSVKVCLLRDNGTINYGLLWFLPLTLVVLVIPFILVVILLALLFIGLWRHWQTLLAATKSDGAKKSQRYK